MLKSITKPRFINLLLVEDDTGDIELTTEALQDSKFCVNLNIVRDGAEAIAYLTHSPPYEAATLPDLVLLDLNLPRKNGQEVLQEIRASRDIRHIPVIIFTMSDAQRDIQEAYHVGANCYITKPIDIDGFTQAIQLVEDFWFSLVSLPNRNPNLVNDDVVNDFA